MDERKSSSINPESLAILNSTIEARVNRLIELGFHKEKYPKNNSREAEILYRHDFILPKNVLLPEVPDVFHQIFLIDPRISLERLVRLGSIRESIALGDKNIKNIVLAPTKEKPYLIFGRYQENPPGSWTQETVKKFDSNEVGQTLSEVIYFYHQIPGYFKDKAFAAGGTRVGDAVPYLVIFNGFPEIHTASVGFPPEYTKIASRFHKTIVLG